MYNSTRGQSCHSQWMNVAMCLSRTRCLTEYSRMFSLSETSIDLLSTWKLAYSTNDRHGEKNQCFLRLCNPQWTRILCFLKDLILSNDWLNKQGMINGFFRSVARISSCLPDGAGGGSNLGPKISSLLSNRSSDTRSLHLSLGVHDHTSVIYTSNEQSAKYPRSRGRRRSFFSSSFSVWPQ